MSMVNEVETILNEIKDRVLFIKKRLARSFPEKNSRATKL